jgi:hypothetical protein
MSTRKEKDATQSPNEWPTSEVMEVARMLYAIEPFDLPGKQWQWSDLALRANLFLDELSAACERIAGRWRTLHLIETQIADAEKLLPALVKVDKGVRYITRKNEHRTPCAISERSCATCTATFKGQRRRQCSHDNSKHRRC